MLRDCLLALRTLHKRPAYAVSVIVTLAIGIGATTLMFSLVDAAILRPLPLPRADRLVFLTGVAGPQRAPRGGSFPEVLDWRAMNQTLQDVAIYDQYSLNLQLGTEVSRVEAEMVSAAYFPILGVQAALGRTFTAEEDAVPDKHAVAVISHGLWQRLFGGDPGILTRTLTLNDRVVSIVGVMPPRFSGLSFNSDVWVPSMLVSLTSAPTVVTSRGNRWLGAVGRLKDGIALDTAQRDFDRVAGILEQQHPDFNRERGVRVDRVRDALLGRRTAGLLFALFGGVVLFLVVACANVASLQLARAVARRRELAVRRALGATRFHIMRQLLAESLVLALLAGIVGSLAAAWALVGVTSWVPPGTLPQYVQTAIDPRAIAFALVASCLAAGLVSILPGLSVYRRDLSGVMKEGERAAGPGLVSLRHPSAQHGLVVAEIALAMTLLSAAGLMVRSLQRQGAVPLGFEQSGVTVARLTLPDARYKVAERAVFVDRLVAELQRVPRVQSATIGTSLPFTGNTSAANLVPDTADTNDRGLRFYRNSVTPGFLDTLRIPLKRGRTFTATDTAGAPLVAMINESAARRIWGDIDPIGRHVRLGNQSGPAVQIVGVVGDARFRDLTTDLAGRVEPDVYFPFAQRTDRDLEVAVRTVDGSTVPLNVLQQAVNGIGGGVPLFRVRPLADAVALQTSSGRFGSMLFGVFSAGALLLSAVGLYGLIAYVVGLGRREIAIRLALGADARRVVTMVVANGMSLAAAGVVLGAAGSYGAGRALRTQLFQTQPIDLLTITAVALLLMFVSFIAAVLPGRSAARVEPHIALRG